MKNRLSELRTERGWSQGDLGKRLKVSRQSVNAIETGRYDPSLPLAFRIARLFGLPIEKIFSDDKLLPELNIPSLPLSQGRRTMTRAFFPTLALAALAPVLSVGAPAVAAAATPVYSNRISVTVMGQGLDVILIPGLASSAHVWDATVAQLSPHYRLHVVQVAGFADTEPSGNASGPVLEPTLAAIHEYIVANHLKAPAVIGHSLGGLIAMKLAIDHPAEVARLMIVDSLPFAGLMAGPQATVASIEPMAARMRAKLLASTQEDYARGEPASMAKLVKSDGAAAKTAIAAASASDRRVVAQALYDAFITDLRPDLARIKQPVTMLYPWDAAHGASQAAIDSLYQSAFATLPRAKLRRIDGSFHFIMIDQPQAFGLAVDAFLAN